MWTASNHAALILKLVPEHWISAHFGSQATCIVLLDYHWSAINLDWMLAQRQSYPHALISTQHTTYVKITQLAWPVLSNPANVKKRLLFFFFFWEERAMTLVAEKLYFVSLKRAFEHQSLLLWCAERGMWHRFVFPRRALSGHWKTDKHSAWEETGWMGAFWAHTHTPPHLLPSYLKFLWCALVAPSKNTRKSLTQQRKENSTWGKQVERRDNCTQRSGSHLVKKKHCGQ